MPASVIYAGRGCPFTHSCVGVIARNTALRAIDRAREMPAGWVLPIPPADCRNVESMTLPRKKVACVISRLAQESIREEPLLCFSVLGSIGVS